ncbi:TolC family protein [Paucibacter sp. AS339]|uniref:TolC family protein n=1 Tax=Paucibacter hankyongi TaxID=3133434 RepID=UPI0030A6EE96
MTPRSFDAAPAQRSRIASAALLSLTLLAGCASLNPQARFEPIQAQTQTLLKQDLQWARTPEQRAALDARVAELLATPLTVDRAVQVALLNHRGLQAQLHQLGIADAALVQATRLPNPGFSLGRLKRGDELEIERGLHFNLMSLLTSSTRGRVAELDAQLLQRELGQQVLKVAADARRAYWMALAAQQLQQYSQQVMEAAEAGADLAQRMAAVGNLSKLKQAREQSFYADAALGLAHAEIETLARREALVRALGLWGPQLARLTLPERLPDLPAQAIDRPEVERLAIQQRLDVQEAKKAAEASAAQMGLSRSTRFINVLELGWVSNRSNHDPTQTGFELSLELPLFDWGEARVAHAEARYMQALERTAHVAITARSEAREAYAQYRSAFDIARHYRDEVVPLRKRISDENLLLYNGMFIGTFELLADARAQISAVAAAIAAQRDFFVAEADLNQALLGPLTAAASSAAPMSTAAEASGGH